MKKSLLVTGMLLSATVAFAQPLSKITFDTVCKRNDSNGDRLISKDEFKGNPTLFKQFDANGDGSVSEAEFDSFQKKKAARPDPPQRQNRQGATPDGVKKHSQIEYASIEGESLKLDLYLPEETEGLIPLVVWIHGGGWKNGDKAHVNSAILRLSGEGYAIASINYRLDDLSSHPNNIHDCKGAVRWLRAHASDYGYDPTRIGVAGSSAGGHLALLLGLSNANDELEGTVGGNTNESSEVKSIVDYYGPTDLNIMAAESVRFNKAHTFTEAQLSHASPLTYLSKSAPPVLILHGDQDRIIPASQSELAHQRYQELGLHSELHILEGAGHGGRDFVDEARYQIVKSFLDETL